MFNGPGGVQSLHSLGAEVYLKWGLKDLLMKKSNHQRVF